MHVGDHFGHSLATVSAVTASTTSQMILYGSSARKGVLFFNHSTAACFMKFGPGASVTDFTVKLSSGSYYEMPLPIHSGTITGIWDAAVGRLLITEL